MPGGMHTQLPVSHTEAQQPRSDPDFRANKPLNVLDSL